MATAKAKATTNTTNAQAPASKNKLVIRRLPPTLPEETFWNSVAAWITDETCLWKRYVKGESGDKNDGYPTFSRAYVLMSDPQSLVDFHTAYDGHIFRSKTGQEYQAVVEYAPVQKTPVKSKVKTDARQGTIEDEPDFVSFLESLKAPFAKAPLETAPAVPQPKSTPLLDHLRAHGTRSKKAKNTSTDASSDVTARRAAASITAAAAKRTPHADAGPKMLAGKGREVSVSQASVGNGDIHAKDDADAKKKKGRGKKQGGGTGEKMQAQKDTPSSAAVPEPKVKILPRPPQQARGTVALNTTPAGAIAKATAPPVPALKATPGPAEPARPAASGEGGRGKNSSRGAASSSAGGNAARGRGKGGDNKERSAQATVISILTRNAEGSGGAKAGTRGGRGKVVEPGASTARIDG